MSGIRATERMVRGAYPQEIIDRARRLAEIHPLVTVAAILKVSDNCLGRARARGWKAASVRGKALPQRPDDLTIQCDHMTVDEMAAHYGVARSTVRKWLVGIPRDYKPRKVDRALPVPSREVIIKALDGRSIDEAADLLGVHEQTLQKWRQHYGMPVALRPRKWRR